MKLVNKTISITELKPMATKMFDNLVKAVVDAEMHADEEAFLLDEGSEQKNLWGVNLYPARFNTAKFVKFDSMINIRPGHNSTRGVNDIKLQKKIIDIVNKLVKL